MTGLVGNLTAGDKETEGHVVETVDAGVQGREHGVDELVEKRRLRGPVVVEVFSRLVAAGELERCRDNWRIGVFYALRAFTEYLLRSLKKLMIVSRASKIRFQP